MKSISFSLYIATVFLFMVINEIIYATPTPTPTPILCSMSGQVTDAITGAGINGATVTFDTGESSTTSTVQGQAGVFAIQGVTVGQHDITASAEGYFSSTQTVTFVEGNPNPQTGANIINFALTPTTGTLGGQVTDAVTGTPIIGAIVMLNTGETDTTRVNGVYVFQKIDVGDYIVSVSAEGYITASQTATISPGITTRVDFALVPITALTPTPIVTPTPSCDANSIEAFPKKLKLKREESDSVTVTVLCEDGSPVVGETVTTKIKSGKKRITVTPLSQATNTSGQAIFTITATNKTGNAKVKFETNNGLKTTVTVKVRGK